MKPRVIMTSTPSSPNLFFKMFLEKRFETWAKEYYDSCTTEHGRKQIVQEMLTMLDSNQYVEKWVKPLARK